MNIKEKLEKLKEMKVFDNPKISPEGHGTFLTPIQNLATLAHAKKKEADAIRDSDKVNCFYLYLDSVFLYIKAYRNDEKIQKRNLPEAWQNLSKYVFELIQMLKPEEKWFKGVFEYILFNIKFYYLPFVHSKDEKEHQHIINEYKNLKYIFEKSEVEKFCILKIDSLEDYVKRHMIMKINNEQCSN